jgi:hypothetical protein
MSLRHMPLPGNPLICITTMVELGYRARSQQPALGLIVTIRLNVSRRGLASAEAISAGGRCREINIADPASTPLS